METSTSINRNIDDEECCQDQQDPTRHHFPDLYIDREDSLLPIEGVPQKPQVHSENSLPQLNIKAARQRKDSDQTRLGPLLDIQDALNNEVEEPFCRSSSVAKPPKQSRLDLMRKKLIGKMQINGETSQSANQLQQIKKISEHFKSEYLESLKTCFETFYDLDIQLGQGMHATVYKCFKKEDKNREKPLAVKIVRESDEEKINAHKLEFQITQRLNNKHIVKSKEIFVNTLKMEVHQVMEFIDGQEVFDQIASCGAYSEKEALHIFRQIIEGIAYLHENGVCHRDMKPSNILVTANHDVYIADFNVARERVGVTFRMLTKTGTLAFSAPEIFTLSYYDEKIDIWSAGTVLYMMLSGQQPFDDQNVPKLINKITTGQYNMRDPIWDKISAQAKDLIDKLLNLDPHKRLSAAQALDHPWFLLDFNESLTILKEVSEDFNFRKSRKMQGQLDLPQFLKIENINQEILEKGLEIGKITYTKSLLTNHLSFFIEQTRMEKNNSGPKNSKNTSAQLRSLKTESNQVEEQNKIVEFSSSESSSEEGDQFEKAKELTECMDKFKEIDDFLIEDK